MPSGAPCALASSYVSSGTTSLSSRHHSDTSGFFSVLGVENLRLQVSLGMMVHSWAGFRLGTRRVWNLKEEKGKVRILSGAEITLLETPAEGF